MALTELRIMRVKIKSHSASALLDEGDTFESCCRATTVSQKHAEELPGAASAPDPGRMRTGIQLVESSGALGLPDLSQRELFIRGS